MATLYLTKEELAAKYMTIAELVWLCGQNDYGTWGLLSNDSHECRFGTADERWKLAVSLRDIIAMLQGKCRQYGIENVLFCYYVDIRNNDIECTGEAVLGHLPPNRILRKRPAPALKH